jgi:hypothetical protein
MRLSQAATSARRYRGMLGDSQTARGPTPAARQRLSVDRLTCKTSATSAVVINAGNIRTCSMINSSHR